MSNSPFSTNNPGVGGLDELTTSEETVVQEIDSITHSDGVFIISSSGSWVGINFVDGETPSGTINGSNTSFTLANTPFNSSVRLYVNGMRFEEGASNDYTISGTTITTNTAPPTGSRMLADYRYLA